MTSFVNKNSFNTSVSFDSSIKKITGRSLGAAFIVAGTAIGAGMLALPIISFQVGFLASSFIMILMWGFMLTNALISLELSLQYGEGGSMALIAREVLGKSGYMITFLSLFLMLHVLVAAYITGGTEIIQSTLSSYSLSLPSSFISTIFVIGFGIFIYFCTQAVDYANRLFFAIKLLFFISLLAVLLPSCQVHNLFVKSFNSLGEIWLTLPIFFASFGFHNSIPSLVRYVGPHPKQLRIALFLGSIIPLIVYFTWQISTLGIIPAGALTTSNSNLQGFIALLKKVSGSETLYWFITWFSFLAIVTSFLGVSISLFDLTAETFHHKNTGKGRLKTFCFTFLPAFLFAMFYPNAFVIFLGYVSIALAIFAILIPCFVVWKRKGSSDFILYKKPVISVCFLGGLFIIAIELWKIFS